MAFTLPLNHKDLSVVICGEAGQGLQTLSAQIVRASRISGYHVFSTKEYMSRVRGGANSSQVRISRQRVAAPVDRVDLLVILSADTARRIACRVTAGTLVVCDPGGAPDSVSRAAGAVVELPLAETASGAGRGAYQGSVAFGLVARLAGVGADAVKAALAATVGKKGEEALDANTRAALAGYDMGERLVGEGRVSPALAAPDKAERELVVNGAEAVSLGAIAGGCDFIAAYPMSPSTGVLTFLSKHAGRFGIKAEQCEDEIAGINMALGAWYAGSRALVSTSGGGFALMEEGVSLAGMIESPVVIHLAQRPGPATGLPTRTEQGDLELALHAGHGEFPRVILAPGSVREAFYLTHRAFNLASRFQVPVFVLTDQYLVDTVVNTPAFDLSGLDVEGGIVRTEAGFKRYALTGTGLSPRGVPGHGEGLVMVDSDEHDEDGRITEDMEMRVRMVDKRLGKLDMIKGDITPPTLIGAEGAPIVLLGWGSTLEVAREALQIIDSPDILFVHNSQPYPLHPRTLELARAAKRLAVVEGNATGQFARLVHAETGRRADDLILKYNGLQFSVEELSERMGALS